MIMIVGASSADTSDPMGVLIFLAALGFAAVLEAVVFSFLRDARRTGVPIEWSRGSGRIRTGP
ncbi:hypothetical protein, partial [Streptomyces violaceorubidus]